LSDLVDAWTPRIDVLEQFDARGLLHEFSDMLRSELDFRREAANQKLFREIFANEFGFRVPEVIDSLSTEAVLTHARVNGMKPGDLDGLSKRRRAAVSRRIARFILEPAFEHGILYVDPHPGNLLVQENGTLAVVDFGMVQRLTPEARRRVADMLVAIGRCDAERLTYRLIEIAAPTHPIDRTAIAAQLDRMLQRYVNVSFENLPFAEALSELLELFREHRLRLPTNVAQLFKALVMCEGIVRSIDPESGLADYLEPFAGKSAYAAVGGDGWDARLRDSVADAAELTITLPRRIDSVLSEIERGNLRVWTRVEDVEPLLRRFERVVERANATMLAAACIVGLAIVMQFYHPQGWRGWIGFFFAVAAVAAIFGSLRTLFALRR
jgi:ubiquinone biosynthesis protein